MPKKKKKGHFDTKLFRFLRELSINNDREWFKANKPRYEVEVRDPFLAFIADFAPHLAKVTKHLVADPRPTGGSFFRSIGTHDVCSPEFLSTFTKAMKTAAPFNRFLAEAVDLEW